MHVNKRFAKSFGTYSHDISSKKKIRATAKILLNNTAHDDAMGYAFSDQYKNVQNYLEEQGHSNFSSILGSNTASPTASTNFKPRASMNRGS